MSVVVPAKRYKHYCTIYDKSHLSQQVANITYPTQEMWEFIQLRFHTPHIQTVALI